MSRDQSKTNLPRVFDLGPEIRLRARINQEFDEFLRQLGEGGNLLNSTPNDIALLLIEVRETLKRLVAEEAILKTELKKHFSVGAKDLDLTNAIAFLEVRSRSDLDRKGLTTELGIELIERFTKHSTYDVLSVKRKGG